MRAVPTSLLSAGGLVAGYGVAVATTRPLGGVVLAAVGVVCGLQWRQGRGLGVALGLGAVYLAAFALSHVLAGPVGLSAWVSVLLVAAGCAAIVHAVVERPAPVRV